MLTLDMSVILLSLDKTYHKKQSKKFKNHRYDLVQVIFNNSIGGYQELGSSVNK